VKIDPLYLSEDAFDQLESNTLLFYTGVKRSASEVLSSQNKGASNSDFKVLESLHEIKKIGEKIKESLEKEDLPRFGELLDLHWQVKKKLSDKISFDKVNQWYELAKHKGALGGKLMGAGGGGFFMFYCNNGKNGFRKALEQAGLKEMRFNLDFEGSKVIVNI